VEDKELVAEDKELEVQCRLQPFTITAGASPPLMVWRTERIAIFMGKQSLSRENIPLVIQRQAA
jgi:hypothetical protein